MFGLNGLMRAIALFRAELLNIAGILHWPLNLYRQGNEPQEKILIFRVTILKRRGCLEPRRDDTVGSDPSPLTACPP